MGGEEFPYRGRGTHMDLLDFERQKGEGEPFSWGGACLKKGMSWGAH